MKNIDSNSDILLILSPCSDTRWPFLGLGYIESFLSYKGFKVDVLDINIDLFNTTEYKSFWEEDKSKLWSDRDRFETIQITFNDDIDYYVYKILDSGIKILGFSIHDMNILFSLEIAKRIKARNKSIKIIFGGPSFFNLGRLKEVSLYVDYLVIGEGEISTFELVNTIINKKPVTNIPGVVTCNNSKSQSNFIPRKLIKNLDNLPFPTYKGFNLKNYTISYKLSIILSRGCGYGRCTFCDVKSRWRKLRLRSAQDVVKEIKYHLYRNDIDLFTFNDSFINLDLELLNSICDSIIDKQLNTKTDSGLKLDGQILVRKNITPELLQKMRKAGFWRLEFGLESGSPTVLKRMNKGFTVEDAERVLKLTKEAGIMTAINIIVGFPGESRDEFYQTCEFIKRNKEFIDRIEGLNTCKILEGSRLDKDRKNFGINHLSYKTSYGDDWASLGNTYDERIWRKKEFISLINSINIQHGSEQDKLIDK